jgi:hypothetical protein
MPRLLAAFLLQLLPLSASSSSPAFLPTATYTSTCDSLSCTILSSSLARLSPIKAAINSNQVYPSLGTAADAISTSALEKFAAEAPSCGTDPSHSAIYDAKLAALEQQLDAPLQALYYRQLAILRNKAIADYLRDVASGELSEGEAARAAEEEFVQGAEESTRVGAVDGVDGDSSEHSDSSAWDYSAERQSLVSTLASLGSSSRKLTDAALKSSQQQSTAMQYLQMQQQQLQQLQMQLYGGNSPWNLGVAYRVPSTNFNIQGNYQQGKTNLQISCVPDEYASMLGPNGFTNGVGPGNLGLSLNLNL